ncbi:MAG: YciI family protein, partial [Mesorhizobium sp.]
RKVKGESIVIDGPFAETKEQFLGFYTLECADLDEAVEFARELSEVNPSGGSYEIRPVSIFNPAKVSA